MMTNNNNNAIIERILRTRSTRSALILQRNRKVIRNGNKHVRHNQIEISWFLYSNVNIDGNEKRIVKRKRYIRSQTRENNRSSHERVILEGNLFS